MVNGDPTTFLFPVKLKITRENGVSFTVHANMGGSNYEQAAMNAVNCYQRWYPDCKVEAV